MFLDLTQFDVKGLDLVYEINEDLCDKLLDEVRKEGKSDSEDHKEKLRKLGWFLCELKHVSDEIDKRKQEKLIYSIQDIYKFAGQFDKFVSFSFYRSSEAYEKYGNEAYGHIIYKKKERDSLEAIIANENYERTDGKVLLKGASKNNKKNELLESEGFVSSDIFEISSFDNYKIDKRYRKAGQKEIPNKLPIKYDKGITDRVDDRIYIQSFKLQHGYTLLQHDYVDLYANLVVANPQLVSQNDIKEYLLDTNGKTFTKDVSIIVLTAKAIKCIATDEELLYLNQLLKERKSQRLKIFQKQLGISQKELDKFRELYPSNYKELNVVFTNFETETLSISKTEYPVYWDFERFAHIYSRHYKNFLVAKPALEKTPFQYSYIDIRRLACLIIEKLKDEIDISLSQGRQFGKYSDEAFYFDGNYYNIRIESTGKLMQFHPLECENAR